MLHVGRDGNDSLRLRNIASQLLGTSDAKLNDDDVERLFDVLTVREVPGQKIVLIIDDAELLQPDVIGYLRLLSSLSMAMMPQIVLFGRPEFWEAAKRAAPSNLADLITATGNLTD